MVFDSYAVDIILEEEFVNTLYNDIFVSLSYVVNSSICQMLCLIITIPFLYFLNF